jgi:protein O-mannosyl-transferase
MSEKKVDLIFIVTLIILSGIMFALNYDVPFFYDDHGQIVLNKNLHNFFDWPAIFSEGLRSNRVIQNITFAFNWTISPNETWSFHLFNNLIHLLNTILVFKILPLLGFRDRPVLIMTCLIFFLHPLQIESVTYIMGRIELLKTMSTLGAIYLYLKNTRRQFLIYFILSASLLIKETSVLTPLFFIAIDILIYKKRFKNIHLKEHALYLSHAIWFIPIKYIYNFESYAGVVGFDLYPFGQYIISSFHHLTFSFYLFFNPAEQSIYHEWADSPPIWSVILGISLYALMAAYSLIKWKQYPRIIFMIFFFLISFGPNFSILQFINPFAEYRLYQSNMVVGLMLSSIVFSGAKMLKVRKAIGFALVIYFAIFHYFYLSIWHHPVTLWSYAVEKYPHSLAANFNLGVEYQSRNMCQNALNSFAKGCTNPRFPHFQTRCDVFRFYIYLMRDDLENALLMIKSLHNYEVVKTPEHFHNYLMITHDLGLIESYEEILDEAIGLYPRLFKRAENRDLVSFERTKSLSRCVENEIIFSPNELAN